MKMRKKNSCPSSAAPSRISWKNGMDQKAIEAGINYFEFRFREADFSSFPKGLMYGIDVFDSWLYDENKPFAYLQQLAIYDELEKTGKRRLFRRPDPDVSAGQHPCLHRDPHSKDRSCRRK